VTGLVGRGGCEALVCMSVWGVGRRRKEKAKAPPLSWLRRKTSWNLSNRLSPTTTLRCVVLRSPRPRRGSTFTTRSRIQSTWGFDPSSYHRHQLSVKTGSSTLLLRLRRTSISYLPPMTPPRSVGARKPSMTSLIARRSRWTPRTSSFNSIPSAWVSSRSSRNSYSGARRIKCLSTPRYTS
jgi:hypothetical protein